MTATTDQATPLNTELVVRVQEFCENAKLANTRVVLMMDSYGEEGIYYPAQSVTVYGPAIAKLRTILNELAPE